MTMDAMTIAAKRYPEGLPGTLTVKEFCTLMGVSRPTGLKIIRRYPEYTEPCGNTQRIAVGLYLRLSKDECAGVAKGVGDE